MAAGKFDGEPEIQAILAGMSNPEASPRVAEALKDWADTLSRSSVDYPDEERDALQKKLVETYVRLPDSTAPP